MAAGKRLRAHRVRLGLGLRAAAEQLHVSHPTLRDWEEEEQIPSPPYRDAIEIWTRGDVKADSWPVSDREKETAKNASLVKPARPTGTEG